MKTYTIEGSHYSGFNIRALTPTQALDSLSINPRTFCVGKVAVTCNDDGHLTEFDALPLVEVGADG